MDTPTPTPALTPQQELNKLCAAMEILTKAAMVIIRDNEELAHAGFIYLATNRPGIFRCAMIGATDTSTDLLVEAGKRQRELANIMAVAVYELDVYFALENRQN